jgi:UDPglucose 6-dehydrogenase
VIVGCDNVAVGRSVAELFSPMKANVVLMDLPSAEMSKHCINTFLATSVTLANQWADVCGALGADYADVAAAVKLDPRIGPNAYLTPGLGFSGGTLGRDLQVLNSIHEAAIVRAPLFGQIWDYNASRPHVVRSVLEQSLGDLGQATICLLGMTYKAGTSTLRRSVAVQVAEALATTGTRLTAYDPQADWGSTSLPSSLSICDSAYDAARDSDAVVLLTEWPEFRTLDYPELLKSMVGSIMFDTKGLLLSQAETLRDQGWDLLQFGRSHGAIGPQNG